MVSVFPDILELKPSVLDTTEYMHRVNEINKPCQWLHHCYDGKCPAFKIINGNFYCARKDTH